MKQELRSLFSDVVKLKNSRSPRILARLAYTYWEMGRPDDAIRAFRTAAMRAPKSEGISLGLFHSLWETGDRQGALEEAKRFTLHSNSDVYTEIMKVIKEGWM